METAKGPLTVDRDSFSVALSFSETTRSLFSAGSVTDTLVSVVELAVMDVISSRYQLHQTDRASDRQMSLAVRCFETMVFAWHTDRHSS